MEAIFVIFILFNFALCDFLTEQQEALSLLEELNKEVEAVLNKLLISHWDYLTNLTDDNLKKSTEATKDFSRFKKYAWEKVIKLNWKKFPDETIRRQFQSYAIIGSGALPAEKLEKLEKVKGDMEKIYSTAKICDFKNKTKCDLHLDPDINDILATSLDPEGSKHVWVEYQKAVGPACRPLYQEFIDLVNEEARLNNFTDRAEYELHDYEDSSMRDQLEDLWQQLRPFYLQLHAYIRFQLRKIYGDIVPERGPIPAHLLGQILAQDWTHFKKHIKPFPDAQHEDLTAELKRQNYTVLKIFKTAEDFFKSINLTELPQSFWEKSIIEKPTDRNIVCHATSMDFRDGKDFRIKQCTVVDFDYFLITHHEMGHIEYFIQYKDQPIWLRGGSNGGFQEAVGDLIALSVQSPKHLRKLGLLKSKNDSSSNVLDNLLRIALEKIAFLPFGYLVDQWRWNVYAGNFTSANYNCKWWELREKYQGIVPPVNRGESDFDPASLYHIVADSSYIQYFIAYVLQFQFHKSLCEIAGEYDPNDLSKPLYQCDIYQNVNAGNALKKMLQLGESRSWHYALEQLTGQRNMDASGLLEYFQPLRKWLEDENKKNNVFIGWEPTNSDNINYCQK